MSTTLLAPASPHGLSFLFFPLPNGLLHVCALHTAKTRLSPLLFLFLTPLSSRPHTHACSCPPTPRGVTPLWIPFFLSLVKQLPLPPRIGPPLGSTSTVACSYPPTTFNLSLTGIPPTRVINTPNPSGNGNIKHSSNKNTTYSKTASTLLSVTPPPTPTITDISTNFIDNTTEITLSFSNKGRKYNFSTIKNKNYRNSNNSNRLKLDPSPTPLLTPLP